MSVNPRTITWTNPTARIDGSAYGQADNAGYELAIAAGASPPPVTGQVSIPVAWGTSFDISTLAAYQALAGGAYEFFLRVVDKAGVVSEWSNAAPFSIARPPMAPTNLAVA